MPKAKDIDIRRFSSTKGEFASALKKVSKRIYNPKLSPK